MDVNWKKMVALKYIIHDELARLVILLWLIKNKQTKTQTSTNKQTHTHNQTKATPQKNRPALNAVHYC